MRRALYPAGVALLALGAGLLGYLLFSGGDEAAAPVPVEYVAESPCTDCAVTVTSVEVQDRDGSTLFIFRGDWPEGPADLSEDISMTANDVELLLRPSADGFEIVEGTVGGDPLPEHTVAAAVGAGVFVVNLKDEILEAPVRFALGSLFLSGAEIDWTAGEAPKLAAEVAPPPPPATTEAKTETETEPETVEAFLDQFAAAYKTGDAEFLRSRLNPATLEMYGEKQCAALVKTLKDPTAAYEVLKVSKLKPYAYAPDGKSVTVPNVYTVAVRATVSGETTETDIHLAPMGDKLTWFADCGDPL